MTRILHGPGGAAQGMRTSILARLASLVSACACRHLVALPLSLREGRKMRKVPQAHMFLSKKARLLRTCLTNLASGTASSCSISAVSVQGQACARIVLKDANN